MEILVLGPVRALRDDAQIPLKGPRERAVLAALALAGPEGTDLGRLVDRVWGERAPRTATRTLQAYLSRLRSSLGPEVIVTASRRHRIGAATVDLWRFHDLCAMARATPAEADRALREALALWRDPVPACDATLHGADLELAALGRARLDAAELLLDHLDDHGAVDAAERLLAEEPHREVAWLRLSTALYRLGRPADALDAVGRARRHLVGELGLDPTPALVALESDLLNHRLADRPVGVTPPTPLTALVGRDALRTDVTARLRRHRLVTLLGTGGIGKTRVAIAVATGQPSCFAALGGATTNRAVENTLLMAVGADPDRDDPVGAVAERLERSRTLIVLDNCEHVVPAAAELAQQILQRCPGVRILATSRAPLGVAGEVLVEVPPLAVATEALELFTARAAEVTDVSSWTDHDRAEAGAICRALDGLPLALELTARRLRYAPLSDTRRQLGTVEASSPAGEPRHRSLAAALESSYAALDPPARRAFRCLALLRGAVPTETAEGIAGGRELVSALIDGSLLVNDGGGVRMYEPVRQYAAGMIDADERAAIQRVIADEITALAERAEPHLTGADELHWFGVLERVHDDVRAVLEWASVAGQREILTRLTAAVGYLWLLGWGVREGRPWIEQALAATDGGPLRARLLHDASLVALRRGELDRARTLADEAVRIARRLGDGRLLGFALHARAQPDKYGDGVEDARTILREAVAVRRESGDLAGTAMSIGALADIDVNVGDFTAAVERYAIGLPLMRRSGSPRGLLAFLHSMAELEVLRGQPQRALELVAEGRLLAEQVQDLWHRALLAVVAVSAARDLRAPADEQSALARAALIACAAQTDPVVTLDGVEAVAGVLLDVGEPAAALRLLRGAGSVRSERCLPVAVPRRARRDADEAAAARAIEQPAHALPIDVDWLVAAAVEALG